MYFIHFRALQYFHSRFAPTTGRVQQAAACLPGPHSDVAQLLLQTSDVERSAVTVVRASE